MEYIQGLSSAREQIFILRGVSFALRYLPFVMRWELDFDNGSGVAATSIRINRGSLLRLFKRFLGFDIVCGGNFDFPFMVDDFSEGRFWLEVHDVA